MADASEGLSAEARSLLAAVKRVSEVSATKSLSELEPLIESALLLSPRTPEELGEDLLAVCDLLSLQVTKTSVSLSLSCAATALQIQSRGGLSRAVLEQILADLLLPLLCSNSPEASNSRAQVSHAITQLLESAGAWDLVALLFCQAVVAVESLQWHGKQPFEAASLDGLLGDVTLRLSTRALLDASAGLPFAACCHVVSHMLGATSAMAATGAAMVPETSRQVQGLLAQISRQRLLLRALDLLEAKERNSRKIVLQLLLPPVVAQCSTGPADDTLGYSTWSVCRRLLTDPGPRRQTGLAALIQLLGVLPLEAIRGAPDATWPGSSEFWALLKACLADKDPLVRKRGLFIVQKAVGPEWHAEPHWTAFSAVAAGLEEFAVHLVQPALVHMDALHPPSDAENPEQAASAGPAQSVGHVWSYSWVEVLWKLGLTHKNPMVGKMVAQVLFERDRCASRLSEMSNEFIVGVLLPAMESNVHHKAEAAEGTSKAMQQLAEFVAAYIKGSQGTEAAHSSMVSILNSLGSRSSAFTRVGLPVALAAAEAAALALKDVRQAAASSGANHVCPDGWMDASIAALCQAAGAVALHPGVAFQNRHYETILRIAASLAWLPADNDDFITRRVSVPGAMRLLAQLPASHTIQGKPLGDAATAWLLPDSEDRRLQAWLSDGTETLVQGLLHSTTAPGHSTASGAANSQADMEAWDRQATQLARLVVLCSPAAPEVTRRILATLQSAVAAACQRSYTEPSAFERSFLFIRALLQASGNETPAANGACLARHLAAVAAPDVVAAVGTYAYVYWRAPEPVPKDGQKLPSGLPQLSAASLKASRRATLSINVLGLCLREVSRSGTRTMEAVSASASLRGSAEEWLGRLASTPTCGQSHPGPADAAAGTTWPTMQLAALEAAQQLCHLLSSAVAAGGFSLSTRVASGALAGVTRELDHRKEGLAAAGLKPEPLDAKFVYLEACFSLSPATSDDIPEGVLQPSAQATMVLEACEALKQASERWSVPLLRVLRRLVTSAILRPEVEEAWHQGGVASAAGEGEGRLSCLLSRPLSGVIGLLQKQKRRKSTINAAIICCLFPSAAFCVEGNPRLMALHSPGGAVQTAAQGLLLEVERKSGSLSHLAAMQLSSLCSAHPEAALSYKACFCKLLLEGAPDTDSDCVINGDPGAPPGSEEAAILPGPIDPELESAYAATAMGPRVATICFLHSLAARCGVLPGNGGDGEGPGDCGAAVYEDPRDVEAGTAAGHAIWRHLFDISKGGELSSSQYKQGGTFHRKKIRLYQAMCCASSFVADAADADEVLAHVLEMLRDFNMANVRQYLEALAVMLVLRAPETLLPGRLVPELSGYEHRHEGLASCVLIAAEVVLHCPEEAERVRLFEEIFPVIMPWAMSHNHNLRTFTQVVLRHVFEALPSIPSISSGQEADGCASDDSNTMTVAAMSSLARLNGFLATNHDLVRLYQVLSPSLTAFNAVEAAKPRTLLLNDVHMIGPATNMLSVFEGAPVPLIDEVNNFLNAERQVRRAAHHEHLAACESEGRRSASSQQPAKVARVMHQESALPTGASSSAPLQRKVGPITGAERWAAGEHDDVAALAALGLGGDETFMAAAGAAGPSEDSSGRSEKLSGGRQHLIVVASLIDKVPNLAGLARTCEVFRASSLVLNDLKVLKDPNFINISVTAEKWIPMEVVNEMSLCSYLQSKSLDGYQLIGLEQTSESVSLPEFDFPAKSVLVLGREREGIPADVLAMLDSCVEIPQLGVIRSLNVHVSGAIAMYEYTRQQRSRITAASSTVIPHQ